jgi:arylsulfatase A-like enzyme
MLIWLMKSLAKRRGKALKFQTMNVVILITDQHAHQFLGCAGYPGLQTPSYDRLASDGIRFRQASCVVSPCLPSRHTILSGQYAFQSGIYTNRHLQAVEDIPPWTMGRTFREAGYATGAFGKMHLMPYHAVIERGSYYGFERRGGPFHETGEAMDSWYTREHPDWETRYIKEREARGIGQGGDVCAAAFLGYTSELRHDQMRDWWVGSQAAAFINENRNRQFFLICSFSGPHAPHVVPADYADLYDPTTIEPPPRPPDDRPDALGFQQYTGLSYDQLPTAIAHYMACVTACDAAHNQVLDTLDRHALYEDTLILFLSDHGELLGARGERAFSKYNLYEQAIRVPLILKPPVSIGTEQTGVTDDSLVNLVDLLPTVTDFAGLSCPSHLPGISLKPRAFGHAPERVRNAALTELQQSDQLHLAIRTSEWKYIDGPYGPELYHTAEDPHEFSNLASNRNCAGDIVDLQSRALDEFRYAFERAGQRRCTYKTRKWNTMMDRTK